MSERIAGIADNSGEALMGGTASGESGNGGGHGQIREGGSGLESSGAAAAAASGEAGAEAGGQKDTGAGKAGGETDNSGNSLLTARLDADKSGPDKSGAGKGAGGGEAGAKEGEAEDPGNRPISDWSGVDLNLPEGMEVDPRLMESLGKAAMECGLTPNQARRLAAWNLEALEAQRQERIAAGRESLAKEWGAKADFNQRQALAAVCRVDRDLEKAGKGAGVFSKALAACGADQNADVVRGLHMISTWLAEDSLGKSSGAPADSGEETALEGLRNALRETRRKPADAF